jgi:hypothetical protein
MRPAEATPQGLGWIRIGQGHGIGDEVLFLGQNHVIPAIP